MLKFSKILMSSTVVALTLTTPTQAGTLYTVGYDIAASRGFMDVTPLEGQLSSALYKGPIPISGMEQLAQMSQDLKVFKYEDPFMRHTGLPIPISEFVN